MFNTMSRIFRLPLCLRTLDIFSFMLLYLLSSVMYLKLFCSFSLLRTPPTCHLCVQQGVTALIAAARNGCVEVVEVLLLKDANITICDEVRFKIQARNFARMKMYYT